MNNRVIILGMNNYGKPRQDFADRLAVMTEQEYHDKTKDVLWLSAYANNNPRSDYHWQADVCYDEAKRRGKPELYDAAYEAALA